MAKTKLGATLAALRHKLQTATKFMEPWEYFHDHVAMVPEHTLAGAPEANPRLERCLRKLADRLYAGVGRAQAAVVDPCFVYVPEHGFWHGSCQVAGRWAICFFFEDIDMGLAGFMTSLFEPGVDLARVTVLEVPERSWSGVAGAGCN